ncbi:Na+/serine symporter [Bradyrhizobium sp. GM22.5]
MAIILILALAGAILLLAIRIVIGWISPTAGKQFSPAIDIAGTFFLKLIVVVAPVAILAVVGFALHDLHQVEQANHDIDIRRHFGIERRLTIT